MRPSVSVVTQLRSPQPDSSYSECRLSGGVEIILDFTPPQALLIVQRHRMPAKLTGWHTHVLCEETCEVAVFLKPQLFGYVGKRFIASSKQLDRIRHADPIDIVLR
jgi:hypothetical protein